MNPMKKLFCVLFCLALLMTGNGSLAATDYTLPEKMEKQLDFGSGLKGTVTLHGEGNDPLILSLQALQDIELQVRGLKSGKQIHAYMYQADDQEQQIGLTEYYSDGDQSWLRSDLQPGEVIRFPGLEKLAEFLFPTEGGNPSLSSVAVRWFQLSESERTALINPVVDELSGDLEAWLAAYADVSPVRIAENGASVIDLSYTIPIRDVWAETVTLMSKLVRSEAGRKLAEALLDQNQAAVFFNGNLDWYYAEAMAQQAAEYDLQYTRTVTTLGTALSSLLELPLDEERTGFQALIIEERDGLLAWTLRSEERLITLQMPEQIDFSQIDEASVWLTVRPTDADQGEGEYHALRITVTHSKTADLDEESRNHERIRWEIRTERDVSRIPEGEDPDRYPEEVPVSLTADLHYYSRYSQSSPTTLEYTVKLEKNQFSLTASGELKTASPWVFRPFSTEGAIEFTALSQDQVSLKIAEWLASAGEQLKGPAADASATGTESAGEENAEEEASADMLGETENETSSAVEAEEAEETQTEVSEGEDQQP